MSEPPRYFTLEEAQAALDIIRPLVAEVMESDFQMVSADEELDAALGSARCAVRARD